MKTFTLAALTGVALANDNGKARTPPLGWRSWNLYGHNVNQPLIEGIMDGMLEKKRMVDGVPTSLCDLGYCDVGLDDYWQACGSPDAAPGMHYHGVDGKPLVNYTRFPSFKNMTDHAHSLGLTAGFYGNNCGCSDHCANPEQCAWQIKGDVDAFVEYNFDSWKLDGCGGELNLVLFNQFLVAAGKPNTTVENCHWGRAVPFKPDPTLPPAEGCPWNFYRSSGDVRASYASVVANLATVDPLYKAKLSYPGCWAYPDMLQGAWGLVLLCRRRWPSLLLTSLARSLPPSHRHRSRLQARPRRRGRPWSHPAGDAHALRRVGHRVLAADALA